MNMRLSRRGALSGIAAGAMAASGLGARPLRRSDDRDDDVLDVAIVGAGVAGCYAAWRISEAAPPGTRIEVFEHSDRIGGRLMSVRMDGLSHRVAELGGMRIANTQTPLLNLVALLGLELEPFPPTVPCDVYMLRGIRTKAEHLRCSPEFGYRPRKELVGKSPGEIFAHLLRILTGREQWTASEFFVARDSFSFRGRSLEDLPYEYVFNEVLGSEGYRFFMETTGYGRPNTQTLAFLEEAALDLFIEKFFHVHGGYDQVPGRIAARARANGVRYRFSSTLVDVGLDERGRIGLVFADASGTTRRVRAERAILAIPDSAYRLLDPDGPLAEPNGLTRALDRLQQVEALKTYCSFDDQWWTKLGIDRGRSITDLPMRQCFYLPDPTGRGATLSPYVSGSEAVAYWRPLLESHVDRRLDPSGLAGRTIVRQLSTMHGIEVPQAREIHYRLFDGGHVGFGWNMWRPGTPYHQMLPQARQPIPGRPLFCIGQATAVFQGWVMGTLRSAEAVLESGFGLERPSWWPADYPV